MPIARRKQPSSSSGAFHLCCCHKLSSSWCHSSRRNRFICVIVAIFGSCQIWVLSTLSRHQKHFRPSQDDHEEVVPPNTRMRPPTTLIPSNKEQQHDGGLLHHLQSCVPTHHACDKYDGILNIKHTDMWSGFGTVFFQLVISQLIYAEEYNLLPIIHLDNTSATIYDNIAHRNMHGKSSDEDEPLMISIEGLPGYSISTIRHARYPQAYFPDAPIKNDDERIQKPPATTTIFHLHGTGVWNDYFLPVNQEYCPTDVSCKTKPLYQMSIEQVSPGLMFYAPWSIKRWRYDLLPDILSRPHVPYETWLLPQRKIASRIVSKYYHVQPDILNNIPPIRDNQLRPANSKDSSCLGLHIRWSDKKIGRRVLELDEFLPYVEDYSNVMEQLLSSSESTSTQPKRRCCIFLATDSSSVVQEIQETWPKRYTQYLIVLSAEQVIRSNSTKHVADLGSHDTINRQILADILCLSRCAYLIHGHSAVSEAVMYLNPTLIYQSVNLEDPNHRLLRKNTIKNSTESTFAKLVHNVTTGLITSDYWTTQYRPPMEWWEHLPSQYYVEYENNGNYYKRSIPPTCSGVGVDDGSNTATGVTTLQNTAAATSTTTNIDLVLTERTYDGHPLSVIRWTTKVIIEFCHILLMKSKSSDNDGEKSHVLVDPIWHYWFHPVSNETDSASKNCSFSISSEHDPKDGGNDHNWSILLNNATQSQQRSGTVSISSAATELIQIRQGMHDILQSQFTIREYIRHRSELVFNAPDKSRCLGIHIGDPGHRRNRKGTKKHIPITWTRKSWGKNKYLEYIHQYFARQSTTTKTSPLKCVYLASDAFEIWDEMRTNLTGLSDLVVYTQWDAARNRNTIKAHWMEDSLERLGSETLVDVLNLASCGQLIHGSHPVAEAALYVNPNVTSIHIDK